MPRSQLIFVVVTAALVGGLFGAFAAVALVGTGEDERGSILRTGVPLFEDGSDMWCSDYNRFCVPRFDDPREARAFYLGETSDQRRQWGCFVEWLPDYETTGVEGDVVTGAFRGACSGSLFLRDGTRVFGPAPRNLDEFRVTYHQQSETRDGQELDTSYLEIDTRTLICGDYSPGAGGSGCELAPPFE